MIYISPAYEKIWGRSCKSLYANPISFIEAIHHDDRERVKRCIIRQTEGPYSEEYRIVQPNGSVRWIKDQSFPIQDQNGATYRIAGVAEDIIDLNPWFSILPFMGFTGQSINVNRETTIGDSGVYDVGDTITDKAASASAEILAIVGKLSF